MAVVRMGGGGQTWSPAAATYTVPLPAVQPGDTLVFAVARRTSAAVTAPSGATVAIPAFSVDSERFVTVYLWTAGASPPAELSWTLGQEAVGSVTWEWFRGADGLGSNATTFPRAEWTSSTRVWLPAITTTVADAMVIAGAVVASSSREFTVPGGWSTSGSLTGGIGQIMATAGVHANQGTLVATDSQIALAVAWEGPWTGWRLALAPGTGEPPPPDDPVIEWALTGAITGVSARVNARITDGPPGDLQVSTNSDLTSPASFTGALTADSVWTWTVTGLTPGTVYHYGLGTTRFGQFRTFPDGPASFTVAAGSCNSTGSNTALWDLVAARNPSLFLHMGDFGYEDIATNNAGLYRAGHKTNLNAARQKALFGKAPLAYVWDDHDFGPNNSDGTHIGRPAAQQVYREYFPHWPLPADSRPGGDGEIYQTFTIGRVRFILLDCKSERTPESATDNTAKTTLGADQKAWLKETLLAATEPLIILEVSEPWIDNTASDGWGMYATERAEIAQFIADNDLTSRVLLIHGDAHMLAADDGTNTNYSTGPGDGPPLFCFAPLDRTNSVKGGPYTEGTHTGSQTQYGTLDIADDGATITVTGTGWQVNGATETAVFTMTATYGTAVPPALSTAALTSPSGRWIKHILRPVFRHGPTWRAVLPTSAGHRLDTLNPVHTPGPVIDDRLSARVTVDTGDGLVFLLASHPTESRLTVLDANLDTVRGSIVPLTTPNHDQSPVTLRHTPGGLWAAVMTGNQVRVARSVDDGATWQAAQTVLTTTTATGLVGLEHTGGTLVLVAVENDGTGRHVRTIPTDTSSYAAGWATETLPGPWLSDDHLSTAALWDGRVIAASKTSDEGMAPTLYSVIRDTDGTWTEQTIEMGPDDGLGFTRPSLTAAGSAVAVHYGHNTTGELHKRVMDLAAPEPVWGPRETVLTGSWDYSQGPATPDTVDTETLWPLVVSDRAGGNMAITWAADWQALPVDDHPMYVGTKRVIEIRVGSVLAFKEE